MTIKENKTQDGFVMKTSGFVRVMTVTALFFMAVVLYANLYIY